jgi:hypothetical protein
MVVSRGSSASPLLSPLFKYIRSVFCLLSLEVSKHQQVFLPNHYTDYIFLVNMPYPFLRIEALLLLTLTTLSSAIPNNVSALDATDAVVVGHLFPTCNGRKARKSINVPVDRCLNTPNLALEIKSAAICANGTRAQWARFPEKRCGYGTLDAEFGLVELEDKDISTCLDVMKIESMAFWCDGVKKSNPDDDEDGEEPENEDKSQEGSVSESACMIGKAPFWNHPKADTCVNLGFEKLKVSSAAICANGTQSTLALYKETGCLGAPSEFRAVNQAESKGCLNVEGMNSFAFYCTGEGIERGRGREHGRNGGGGSIMHFLLILTLIVMMSSLMLVLSIFTWVRKYGGSVGKLIEFARVSCSSLVFLVNTNTNFLLLEPREAKGRRYRYMRSA